nr:ankyrin repeat domain-containing protein [Treponema sp.]
DFLIRAGADLAIPDKEGRTALSLAAECGKTGIVTRLLDAGADAQHKDRKGMCAFSWAVCGGHADTLAVFMERNLFPEEELGKALTEAGFRGFADSTDVLIRMSEPAETAAYFALMGACVQDCADVARVCLQYPCDVNMPSEFGMTPLMLACYCSSIEVAGLLVAHGADVNAADEEGMTALMYAAVKHDARTMFFLIGKGADKSAKSAEGKDAGDYFGESDTRDIGELIADRAKAKAAPAGSMADTGTGTANARLGTTGSPEASPTVPAGHKSFGETFDFYMKKYFERFPDKKNSEIYKAARLSKQRFSKILSSRNDPNYRPRKENVTALAMGLKLSLAESEDLLQSAGFILSPRDKADMKIQSFFATGNYNIFDLNNSIYESTGKLFFKSMTAGEEG